MKLKIGHKFNILGREYTLIDPSGLPQDHMGRIDYFARTIEISDSHPSREAYLETLIHELVHGKDWESGLYQTMDQTAKEVNADTVTRLILANFNLSPKRKRKR